MHTCTPANRIVLGPTYSKLTFNTVCFDRNPFSVSCKVSNERKARGFQISHFDWSFVGGIVAVKRLISAQKMSLKHNKDLSRLQ